ncbi:hypothetical protein D3C80_980920 [compost metagenome]
MRPPNQLSAPRRSRRVRRTKSFCVAARKRRPSQAGWRNTSKRKAMTAADTPTSMAKALFNMVATPNCMALSGDTSTMKCRQ